MNEITPAPPIVTPYQLTVAQPAQIRAFCGDEWKDVIIPKNNKGQSSWKMVVETLRTMEATRVQMLDTDGRVIQAVEAPTPVVAPPRADSTTSDLDTFAARIAEAQRIALSSHIEAMKPAWDAITAANKQNVEMSRQMTEMLKAASNMMTVSQEVIGRLQEMIGDATEEMVSARLDASDTTPEVAADAKESALERLAEKALETLGPAIAERIAS